MAIFSKKSDTKKIDYKLKIPASFIERLGEIKKQLKEHDSELELQDSEILSASFESMLSTAEKDLKKIKQKSINHSD